jgi:hypothetical protein
LKQGLREKYPNKGSGEINRVINDIANGKTLMEQSLWMKIIKHMYETTDVATISTKLKALSQIKPLSKTPKGSMNFATENRADNRKKSADPKWKRGRTNSF